MNLLLDFNRLLLTIFTDRSPVATHLPLAWSKATPQDCQQLMNQLDQISLQFKG